MRIPIISTKLYIPPARTKVVLRPRLIERLNEGVHRKLTLISASAGFGKTTLIGYLIFKSGYMPRILGILLIIAGIGYLIDSFVHFLLSNYTDYKTIFLLIVAVPGVIAELSLCLWLLFKGVKVQRTQ